MMKATRPRYEILSPQSIAPSGVAFTRHCPNIRSIQGTVIRVAQLAAVAMLFLLPLSSARGQGFDSLTTSKIKVTMQRRLPAAVHFEGTAFDVHVKARDASLTDVSQRIGDLLPTDLQSENTKLHGDKNSPDLKISCTVTSLDIPKRESFTQNDVAVQKNVEKQQKYYKVVGTLSVAYQATDRAGKTVDARTISARYSEDFNADTNTSANQSLPSKMINPFKRMAGKKTETATAPDTDELKTILITRTVKQIVARLVNTNETIEIYLARGKTLDKADKLAQSGLWQKYNEALETMQPFPDPAVDAYRLYDIGVSYEAQAYQSEDHQQARKFLDEAAINYGKALDAKPAEKYFLDPQNRIETGIEHYRALEASNEPAPAPEDASAKPAAANTAPTAATSSTSAKAGAHNTSSAARSTSSGATSKSGASGSSNSSATSSSALTNDKVVKMVKAGLDEDTIVTAIQDAKSVQFDLSSDGLIQLKNDGVSKKVMTAMQDRAARRTTTRHTTPSNSN
jgi:hypothetical protein